MTTSLFLRRLLLLATAGLMACVSSEDRRPMQTIDSLVSVSWLAEHIDEPDVVVLDCSVVTEQSADGSVQSVSGRRSFDAGHIPTAGFADLMGELADTDRALQFAVPEPEAFVAAMQNLGVGNKSRVVLYDSYRSVWAARVWWMLRWAGFDNVAILDGGLTAWTSAGLPLSTDAPTEPARTLTLALRPELIADRDEVFASLGRPDVDLVDAMPAAHFRGEFAFYDRPGHIPGAENLPALSLVNDEGLFRGNAEISALANGDPGKRTINYCGGGIAASATAFALTRLGYTDVAVYTASLQEWAADPANPMQVAFELDETEE